MISNDFSASRAEVVRTFLKKSIYDAEAKQARIQLLAVPLQVFRALWDDLIAPKASRFNFDLVQNRFGQRQTGSMNPELAANLRVIYGLFARIATPMIWTLANPTGVIGGRHSHLLLSPPASGGAYPARQFHRDPHTAAALRELAEDHLATAESGTALDKIGPTSKGIKSPLRPLFPSLPAQAPQ